MFVLFFSTEEEAEKQALELMESFKRENPGADKYGRLSPQKNRLTKLQGPQGHRTLCRRLLPRVRRIRHRRDHRGPRQD